MRAVPDDWRQEAVQKVAQFIVGTGRELGNDTWSAKCLNGTGYGLEKNKASRGEPGRFASFG
jgi:hypothetical protein